MIDRRRTLEKAVRVLPMAGMARKRSEMLPAEAIAWRCAEANGVPVSVEETGRHALDDRSFACDDRVDGMRWKSYQRRPGNAADPSLARRWYRR